jgi:hypothetical protein
LGLSFRAPASRMSRRACTEGTRGLVVSFIWIKPRSVSKILACWTLSMQAILPWSQLLFCSYDDYSMPSYFNSIMPHTLARMAVGLTDQSLEPFILFCTSA